MAIIFCLMTIIAAVSGTGCLLQKKPVSDAGSDASVENTSLSAAENSIPCSSKTSLSNPSPNLDLERARALYDRIFSDFTVKDTTYLRYFFPVNPSEKEMAYMWPYMQCCAMANAMLEADPENNIYRNNLIRVLDGLEHYRSTFREEICYQSYPTDFGGGDAFYDDNIWIALELYRSYRLLGDERYLRTAEGLFDYVTGGWNEEQGGLYWKESDCTIMTTCTNAPTIMMAIRLYDETGDWKYLDWAEKIYGWVKNTLLADDGVFWDHIDENGRIERTKWTYNTGMMISAAAGLYDSIGEAAYLEDAMYFAESAYGHFASQGNDPATIRYPDTPWFNLLLLQGFADLSAETGDTKYVQSFRPFLDDLWEHKRDPDGYISLKFSVSNSGENYRSLLDQASYVECYEILSKFQQDDH